MKDRRSKWRKRLLIAGLVVLSPFLVYYGLSAAYTGLSFVSEQVSGLERQLFQLNMRTIMFWNSPKHLRIIVNNYDIWVTPSSSDVRNELLSSNQIQDLVAGQIVETDYGHYMLLVNVTGPTTEAMSAVVQCTNKQGELGMCKSEVTRPVYDAYVKVANKVPVEVYLAVVSEHLLALITLSFIWLFLAEKKKGAHERN